jgi:YbbR domain-containing protein
MTVDRRGTKTVPIVPVLLPLPSGLDAGDAVVEEETAVVTGPQSIVETVREVQAPVAIDASGVDVNQLVTLVPIDDLGQALGAATRIEVEPAQVRVRVSVFSDRRSKTLPVSPNVFGTPAAGFEIESVSVEPSVVSVEGDANDLAGLASADTEPVSVAGASSEVVQTVRLSLPDGVEALGTGTVEVTVRLRPVTATRTFQAGLVLVGASPDTQYELSTDRVLVTIGGSLADLDRLSGATLVLNVDVTGLEDGTHLVPVSANLQTGLTLVAASPNPIEVTVTTAPPPPSPSPEPSPTP